MLLDGIFLAFGAIFAGFSNGSPIEGTATFDDLSFEALASIASHLNLSDFRRFTESNRVMARVRQDQHAVRQIVVNTNGIDLFALAHAIRLNVADLALLETLVPANMQDPERFVVVAEAMEAAAGRYRPAIARWIMSNPALIPATNFTAMERNQIFGRALAEASLNPHRDDVASWLMDLQSRNGALTNAQRVDTMDVALEAIASSNSIDAANWIIRLPALSPVGRVVSLKRRYPRVTRAFVAATRNNAYELAMWLIDHSGLDRPPLSAPQRVRLLNQGLASAAQGNAVDTVRRLIFAGANVNAEVPNVIPDQEGYAWGQGDRTPASILEIAAYFGSAGVIDVLLAHPKLDIAKSFSPALSAAVQANRIQIVRQLLNRRPANDQTPLIFAVIEAASQGHADILTELMARGPHPNQINDGTEALNHAAQNGHFEAMRILVDAGITADTMTLRSAISSGELEAVRFVHEEAHIPIEITPDDEDFDITNSNVVMASSFGHLDILKYLVANGADLHVADDWALIEAAEHDQPEIVEYLIANGADVHAHNNEAFVRAEQHGHDAVLEILNQFA
jgi:hypothetical protein